MSFLFPNPDGWFEHICIKGYVPTGSSHTGDLVDIGPLFSFCRYARNQLSSSFGGARPWIPKQGHDPLQGHWDHVLTSVPHGIATLPYTDQTWDDLYKLKEQAEHFHAAMRLVVSEGTLHFAGALLSTVLAEVSKVVGPETLREAIG